MTAPLTFELAPSGTSAGLREHLVANGATRVEPIRVGQPAADRRDASTLDVVAFAVTLTGTVAQVIELSRGWLAARRQQGATAITLTVNGDQIQVTNPSTRTEDALVEAFVQRHSTP